MALTGIVVIFINTYLIANIIGGFEIEIGRGVYGNASLGVILCHKSEYAKHWIYILSET